MLNFVRYLGVNDHKIDLFEGQYRVPDGIAYNSYLIMDEKTAIIDTVDKAFDVEWLRKIKKYLKDKGPDYLVILHMEPDHSALIEEFLTNYPDTTLVTNQMALGMIKQYFPNIKIRNNIIVKENDTLNLGEHTLKFIFAPMVHWPEVMMAYEIVSKTIFSADAFGKFGALDKEDDWVNEARRYYIGIVGKYGNNVQNLFKKISSVEIDNIYPLHGPVLTGDLSLYLNLYDKWSKYEPEDEGVTIAYASVYGHTKAACELLAKELEKRNVSYTLIDLARSDIHEAIAQAFKHQKLILASITYNTDVFPMMDTFVHGLVERNFTNHKVGFIENGTWAPMAKKVLCNKLASCKQLAYLEKTVTIKSAMSETNILDISLLADELAK